jgi:hypothetical protein
MGDAEPAVIGVSCVHDAARVQRQADHKNVVPLLQTDPALAQRRPRPTTQMAERVCGLLKLRKPQDVFRSIYPSKGEHA